MRAALLLTLSFVFFALIWAVHLPVSAYGIVRTLDQPGADVSGAEEELLHAGQAAVPALKSGLTSHAWPVRLRCARVLALSNDASGEDALLEDLRSTSPEAAATAEVYLLSIWERRDSPSAPVRAHIARLESAHKDAEEIALLTECLSRNPGWIGGYIHRAHAYFRSGEIMEARHDALVVLALDVNQFEAMSILAQVFLLLNSPGDAYACLEQAVRVNPRLRTSLREDIRDIFKALDAERDRQRRERQRERPAV